MMGQKEYDDYDLLGYEEHCPHPFYFYKRLSEPESDYPDMNPFRWLIQLCVAQHPGISIEPGIFGGFPHLREIRLAVGDILAQLYVLGSVKAVAEYYGSDISEDRIKEAIAFAQDFVEMACDPHQTYD